jgi:hypothetical protein
VARAKRTDRAEARRRYRAQLTEQARDEADEPIDETEVPSGSAPKRAGRTQPGSATTPTQPSGLGYAFRAAFHQPKYREDIAYLPRLVLHPSVWAPILVTIGTAAVFLATAGRDVLSTFALQYFVAPPPIGAIFIAGFFAPRASYLAGGIVGLVSAVVLAAIVAFAPPSLVSPQAEAQASPAPGASASAGAAASGSPGASSAASASPAVSAAASTTPAESATPSPTPSQAPGSVIPTRMTADQVLISALATSPLSGVFFGAAAAWYRRFLRLANPTRARPPARQAQRRRR